MDVLPIESLDAFNWISLAASLVERFFQRPHCLKRFLYCFGLEASGSN
jgi:hypothetical protein